MTDYSMDVPLAGTDADHLLGSLDRLRATFRWKAGALARRAAHPDRCVGAVAGCVAQAPRAR